MFLKFIIIFYEYFWIFVLNQSSGELLANRDKSLFKILTLFPLHLQEVLNSVPKFCFPFDVERYVAVIIYLNILYERVFSVITGKYLKDK